MKSRKAHNYQAPMISYIDVVMERGFAASGDNILPKLGNEYFE